MNKRIMNMAAALSVMGMLLPLSAGGEGTSAPILYMRLGNVDAKALIEKLAPEGTDVESVLAGRQVMEGYGDDIGGVKAHRDLYTLEGMTVYVQEPSGEITIEWDSEIKTEYERIQEQQREKYDPDGDFYLDDGKTMLFTRDHRFIEEAGEAVEHATRFAQALAKKLGIELLPNPVGGMVYTQTYPDGQTLEMGDARFGMVRHGLPVESLDYWSEISRMGYYVRAESMSVEWCEDQITRATINTYEVESAEAWEGDLIPLEEARSAVEDEIERMKNGTDVEPFVDICYMPVPDPRGELYARFVPAWRFRFLGAEREEGNCHRVNACTGEVIR